MKKSTAKITEFLKARGWNHLPPADIAKSISIEAAELLEIFQWKNFSVEDIRNDAELLRKTKHEIADVLIYALQLPIILDLDADKLIEEKLNYTAKKYPAHLMRKKDGNTTYDKIKKQYRRNKTKKKDPHK